MDFAVIYIGIGESILALVFILKNKSNNITDNILSVWIFLIFSLLVGNALKIRFNTDDFWPLTTNLYLAFPPILFLYSKYIIGEYENFKRIDYLHFLPTLLGVLFVLIYYNPAIKNFKLLLSYYNHELFILKIILGNTFIISLWVYSILTLVTIIRYQKQINNYYSFESGKINLRWLFILTLSYFLFSNFNIAISIATSALGEIPQIEKFRSGVFVIFINIIIIWTYGQKQLASNIAPPRLINKFIKSPNDSDKYKKSGFQIEKAEECKRKLIEYVNSSEVWKDPELSVAKISEQIDIPKYQISQLLNENIKKNFYTFINEYRVEYAMKLIKSPESQSWSFVAIAFESGFNSKSAFNNFFKKYTGKTPSEYKNANS